MPSKIFSIHPTKFQTTFFISCQISGQFAPWMPPPVLHHAPVTTFSLHFLPFTYIFLNKTGPLAAPPGWMPGAVAPSAPPLHATEVKAVSQVCFNGQKNPVTQLFLANSSVEHSGFPSSTISYPDCPQCLWSTHCSSSPFLSHLLINTTTTLASLHHPD